jgi:hypothetical protein
VAVTWAPDGPTSKYGLYDGGAPTSTPSELHAVSSPAAGAIAEGAVTLRNPLVIFAGLAAVTFGLMAFSTTVRVGKTSASVAIGKS